MAEATNPELVGVKFHTLEWDVTHGRPGHEYLIAELTAQWRGETVEFTIRATRYVANDATLGDVWTDWRVYVDSGASTDVQNVAFRAAGEPLVHDYLDSGQYHASRRVSLAYCLKDVIREDARYGASTFRAAEALAHFGKDLEPADLRALSDAVDALAQYLTIMEGIPA